MINKLVFENFRHRPVRSILTVLAIGIEVTMMLTLVGLSRGTLEESAKRARGVGADVWVRPPGSSVLSFSSAPMDERMVNFFLKQPHVTHAMGAIIHGTGGMTSITGMDLDAFARMSGGYRFLQGGPFQGPHDVIVDEYYAQQRNVKVGDTLTLSQHDWRVSGIFEPGKMARVVVPIKTLQELTSNTGKVSQFLIKLDDPKQTPNVIETLKKELDGYNILSVEEFTSMFNVNNLPELSAFIKVVVGISVIVGFLVVSLTMYTAVLERTREIGILKALGASPLYILTIFLRETALLALVGTIIGVLFSFATRWLIMTLIPASLTQMIVPDWWPIAGGIALLGALLGALYPGWKAARQDAIEALAYE